MSSKSKRIFGQVLRIGRSSVEPSKNDSSSAGPSALSAGNSVGFSITAEELMKYLGEDIDLFDIDSVREADHVRLQQLKAVGESWGPSSRVDIEAPGVTGWKADPKTAQMIQIACHASNAIRPKPSSAPPKPPGTEEFSKIESIGSSLSGTVKKSISLYYCGTAGEGVVVVCVKAAGRWGDWVINGGFRMLDVDKDFIDIASSSVHAHIGLSSRSAQSNLQPLQAHAGFLTAARASISSLASALQKAISAPVSAGRYSVTRIIFVGHSAGGAVASLLFAHFITCMRKYPFLNPANISLNHITFGAPPVLSRDINPQLKALLRPSSVFFAFVVEGDPVPKLDMDYMKFLADALRQTREFLPNEAQQRSPQPPLPPLKTHAVGDIIMFRETKEGKDGKDIRMFKVEEDVLGRAAWVNMCVHFMFQYLNLVAVAPGLRVGLT